MKKWLKSGTPWIWLNAGAAALSLIMVIGLVVLIAVRGLSHFWPGDILEVYYAPPGQDRQRLLGEVSTMETVTATIVEESGMPVPGDQDVLQRWLIKLGNRDLTGRDFMWYVEPYLVDRSYPADAMKLERMEWGDFYGYLRQIQENGQVIAEGDAAWDQLYQRIERVADLRAKITDIERYDIGEINGKLEQLRLEQRGHELRGTLSGAVLADLAAARAELEAQYAVLIEERSHLQQQLERDALVAETRDGKFVTIPMKNAVRAVRPNAMGFGGKMAEYMHNISEFVSGYPREANTEGGIFPAIFGTVTMVLVMSVIVTPFGVLAAVYLREYAKQGTVVRLIRISVNNLAGVPSIVFGIFGLGFFVYMAGGSIDRLFYPESLPAPTFGTPGLFWASLTLALLTLPVVIVATEEGLTRIPRAVREGSLALGATKAETLWRTIIPMAAPSMMTGLILAVARAAGEVAPLMLVGVVKLAPTLPIDGTFPFIHLERKFMHLGFHIYDVGFQSPNVEAARPLVYATALTLLVIIIVLNLAAIAIRNHLREKYKSVSD